MQLNCSTELLWKRVCQLWKPYHPTYIWLIYLSAKRYENIPIGGHETPTMPQLAFLQCSSIKWFMPLIRDKRHAIIGIGWRRVTHFGEMEKDLLKTTPRRCCCGCCCCRCWQPSYKCAQRHTSCIHLTLCPFPTVHVVVRSGGPS